MKLKLSRTLLAFIMVCLSVNILYAANPRKALKTGIWRATLELQGLQLPFNFDVVHDRTGGYDIYVLNAEERLLLDEVNMKGDSVDIVLHIFDANIKARIHGDSLTGVFIKNYEQNYRVPFTAVHGQTYRFEPTDVTAKTEQDYSGKYSVDFIHEADTSEAIGIFKQQGNYVTGTFLTTTGDYRYLEGTVSNGMLHLSAFDGNHAYLFTASKQSDGSLMGEFYSGQTWTEFWVAQKNDAASLPDPESLTYLKPGYDHIEFNFPDVNGKKITFPDARYKNKVVVLQIFGTWCPNCMDETTFMSNWYNTNKMRGVEIIGLAYERKSDFSYASSRVRKMIEKLKVPYNFVIAGTNDKDKASETLPMLNRVMAFPTTIIIGKDGKVRNIYTGFSGPGTGLYYDQYIERFNETINGLLSEQVN
ncbi:MAG TPA: TlpA disulfide reductase family protein [Ohtaekwangia sp.]|uniref:TlpA disulfide reductase family protein n=1 Tax=Ohtaekwangia sp. TaxID=2066019 RepID=UPI002F940AE2